jgi:serine/threonine protein kinase
MRFNVVWVEKMLDKLYSSCYYSYSILLLQIADFGISKSKATTSMMVTATKGTCQWQAPESIMGEKGTTAIDVYSFGVILWELNTRQRPWKDKTRKFRMNK